MTKCNCTQDCTSLLTSCLVMVYSPRLVTRPGLLILMLLTAWAVSTLPSLVAMSQARDAPHHTPTPVRMILKKQFVRLKSSITTVDK